MTAKLSRHFTSLTLIGSTIMATLLFSTISTVGAATGNPDAAAVSDEKIDSIQLERLKRAKAKSKNTDAFTAKSWHVPTPTPTPPPPPPPTAPPIPFTYFGKQIEPDGKLTIFLAQGDRMHMVAPGDKIDNTYSVDAIENGKLIMTYLPLQIKQFIILGE